MENQKNRNLGIILIVFGVLFFLSRFIDLAHILWPFYIIVPGILLFVLAFSGGRGTSSLVIPASIITTVGLILFSQNITGNFESWAYAWALIPAASGLGMVIMSNITDNLSLQEKGYRTMKIGLSMFLTFGVFFELFLFHSWMNSGILAWFIPLVLIIGGLAMLIKPRGNYVYIQTETEDDEDND